MPFVSIDLLPFVIIAIMSARLLKKKATKSPSHASAPNNQMYFSNTNKHAKNAPQPKEHLASGDHIPLSLADVQFIKIVEKWIKPLEQLKPQLKVINFITWFWLNIICYSGNNNFISWIILKLHTLTLMNKIIFKKLIFF